MFFYSNLATLIISVCDFRFENCSWQHDDMFCEFGKAPKNHLKDFAPTSNCSMDKSRIEMVSSISSQECSARPNSLSQCSAETETEYKKSPKPNPKPVICIPKLANFVC